MALLYSVQCGVCRIILCTFPHTMSSSLHSVVLYSAVPYTVFTLYNAVQGVPLKSPPLNFLNTKSLCNLWHLEKFGASLHGIMYLKGGRL